MKLSEHFTEAEFTRSDTATRLGIDNRIPADLLGAARNSAAMLEVIRAELCRLAGRDIPIRITSGYRCLRLNRTLGSKDSSDHVLAEAIDFEAPTFESPLEICRALAPNVDALSIGQLINEYPDNGAGWVHVSTRKPANPVNRIITITGRGTFPGILAR